MYGQMACLLFKGPWPFQRFLNTSMSGFKWWQTWRLATEMINNVRIVTRETRRGQKRWTEGHMNCTTGSENVTSVVDNRESVSISVPVLILPSLISNDFIIIIIIITSWFSNVIQSIYLTSAYYLLLLRLSIDNECWSGKRWAFTTKNCSDVQLRYKKRSGESLYTARVYYTVAFSQPESWAFVITGFSPDRRRSVAFFMVKEKPREKPQEWAFRCGMGNKVMTSCDTYYVACT